MAYTDSADYNSYCKKRYHKRRQDALSFLGNQCKHCGSSNNLEFDHVDRSIKTFAISKRLHGLPWEKIKEELSLCQLLCRDCHKKKTSSEKMKKEHGGRSMWDRCKCDPCRAAKNEYMRNYRARRRALGA